MFVLMSLALAGSAYDDGFDAGVGAAKDDGSIAAPLGIGIATGTCGGTACCFAPILLPVGCLIAGGAPTVAALIPSEPDTLPDGADAEYLDGYRDGYTKTRKMQRVKYAAIGAGASLLVVGGTSLALRVMLTPSQQPSDPGDGGGIGGIEPDSNG